MVISLTKLLSPWEFSDVLIIAIKDFPIKPIPGSGRDMTVNRKNPSEKLGKTRDGWKLIWHGRKIVQGRN
jgi:hypothetical protein